MFTKANGRLAAVGCFALALVLSWGSIAQAQEKAAVPVIAVVDVDQVLSESVAAKSVRSQMEKYSQQFQEDTRKEESALRSKQQELENQRKSLSPDAFAERARSFDRSVADFQGKVQMRRRALEKSFSSAMGKVQETMVDVTRQVATDKGSNVVLPRSQVILFDDKMNITKDIIEALNKRLTHVDVAQPKLEAAESSNGHTQHSPAKSKKK